ncbi:MAG: hypothetical protein ABJE47_24020 [bacterium]
MPTDAQGVARYQARIQRALRAGVRIAIGSDLYYANPARTRGAASAAIYGAYVAAGMRPADVLRAATLTGAELLAVNITRSSGCASLCRAVEWCATTQSRVPSRVPQRHALLDQLTIRVDATTSVAHPHRP